MAKQKDALGGDGIPDTTVSAKEVFGLDIDMEIPAFSKPSEHVPTIDPTYRFNPETTLAILAGFAHNRRCMVQGYHGTGKSTHIEQVAARLNWPCIRINLDSHVSRMDLVGKDAIVLKDGQQITEFKEGLLPWALQRACAIVFDEYDAGRPDVMFVIQRVLEVEGKLTLLDQSRVISPHQVRMSYHQYHRSRRSNGSVSRTTINQVRWIAGISSLPSTTYPSRAKSISSRRSTQAWTKRHCLIWCRLQHSHGKGLSTVTLASSCRPEPSLCGPKTRHCSTILDLRSD